MGNTRNGMKVAIVGSGITGLGAGNMLGSVADVVVFEAAKRPGGLISCERLEAGLYHRVGGHVFNTQSEKVADWFWAHFSRSEFYFHPRKARILFRGREIGYPIENHLHELTEGMREKVVAELRGRCDLGGEGFRGSNLQDALWESFGATLCEEYFFPYNRKIWGDRLGEIPLGWLEGKLPQPRPSEVLRAHAAGEGEKAMVHATFYYPRQGGSQFIVDRLASRLEVRYGTPVRRLERSAAGFWTVNGEERERFDAVIYTGDVRRLGEVWSEGMAHAAWGCLERLRTRGLTTVFCERDATTSSWLYLPDPSLACHRVIHTGGFSPANNRGERMTCVVEFPFEVSDDRIDSDLARLPGRFRRLARHDASLAYVIQEADTRQRIADWKDWAAPQGLHLAGRFAEWEYYNMDKALESAMRAAGAVVDLAPTSLSSHEI